MRNFSKHHLLAALGLLLGVLCLFGQRPLPWFGAALLAGLGAVLFQRESERLGQLHACLSQPRLILKYFSVTPINLLSGLFCLAVIVAVALAMLPEAARGDWPVNHDHPVHLFKAWQLRHDFLAEGRLWGWSHKWFAGYPAHYLYPIGSDLWINIVQWASFGLLTLEQAYGVSFFLLWVLLGYSVYRFASVGFNRWVGLLAGVLYMTDTASYRFGGWVYTADWGVWPQALATAFTVLAMARLPQIMESNRWRDIAIFAGFLGASLLTHPAQILHFAIAAPIILIAYWLSAHERPWPVAALRLGAGYLLGILIGGLWVFPFLSVRRFAESYGELWSTTFKMGTDFFDLTILPGTLALVIAMGLFGSVALLWSRKFHNRLTALLVFAFLLAGSATIVAEFHLVELSSAFENLQFQRFSFMLKPYFFVAAAYALTVIFAGVRQVSFESLKAAGNAKRADGMLRVFVAAALPIFLIMPFAVPYFGEFAKTQLSRNLNEASARPHQRERDALVNWFAEKYPDTKPFFRVMLKVDRHDHSFTDLGSRIGFPLYRIGFTPVSNFAYKMETDPPQLLDALNVRYVISKSDLRQSYYKLVENFGALRLYQYTEWKESPFEILEGEGDVSLIRFENEEIVLKADENARGTLRLNVSYFPRWRATLDGEPVAIKPLQLDNFEKTSFITVDLKPGTYRFVFVRSWIEWVSFALFLVSLLLCFLLVLADTPHRRGEALGAKLNARQLKAVGFSKRYAKVFENLFGAALILGALIGVAMAIWVPPLKLERSGLVERIQHTNYDFGDRLLDASVGVERIGKYRGCRQFFDYYACTNESWNRVTQRALNFGAGTIRRCIWAHPIEDSKLLIRFPNVPNSDALVGYYGVAGSGTSSPSAPTQMRVLVDGVEVANLKSERPKELSDFEIPLENSQEFHEVIFEVSAKNVARRHFCFNAQAVDVSEN